MDIHSEQRLALVCPTVSQRIHAGASTLASLGIEIRVVSGLRSKLDQQEAWAKGRTVLTDAAGKPQGIVTNAPPGYSPHEMGMAVDVVPGVHGKTPWAPQWEPEAAEFKAMVVEMKRQGLLWGGAWIHMKGDFDHFYIGPATPNNSMRSALAYGGLQTVWDKFARAV